MVNFIEPKFYLLRRILLPILSTIFSLTTLTTAETVLAQTKTNGCDNSNNYSTEKEVLFSSIFILKIIISNYPKRQVTDCQSSGVLQLNKQVRSSKINSLTECCSNQP